jgi:hypothetical protein
MLQVLSSFCLHAVSTQADCVYMLAVNIFLALSSDQSLLFHVSRVQLHLSSDNRLHKNLKIGAEDFSTLSNDQQITYAIWKVVEVYWTQHKSIRNVYAYYVVQRRQYRTPQ